PQELAIRVDIERVELLDVDVDPVDAEIDREVDELADGPMPGRHGWRPARARRRARGWARGRARRQGGGDAVARRHAGARRRQRRGDREPAEEDPVPGATEAGEHQLHPGAFCLRAGDDLPPEGTGDALVPEVAVV